MPSTIPQIPSAPPPAAWSAMLAGEPPFDGVDTLLFTHGHPDHFSPERLMQYLRYRTVRQVVLPVMEPQHWEILQPFLEERRIQWTLLTARMQTADFQIPGGTVIRPYFTRHIDKAFWNMPHGCYLISFGEKHVLLTADVDYTIETFEQISCVHINAAFVNPLFFNALRTGTFLRAHCSQIFSASIISLFRRMTGGKFARCYRTICTGGIKSKGRLPS